MNLAGNKLQSLLFSLSFPLLLLCVLATPSLLRRVGRRNEDIRGGAEVVEEDRGRDKAGQVDEAGGGEGHDNLIWTLVSVCV